MDVWDGMRLPSDPLAAANFGARVENRQERYDKAHESIQIVQALWGAGNQTLGR